MRRDDLEYPFEEDLNRRLQDPTFKKAYDELDEEFASIQTLIEARRNSREKNR